jgi:3-oxoacyl-[acyl-carrier protein] reductase
MNLKGKTALITGASRGIGKAIAIELAHQGINKLLLVARNRQKLAEVAREIASLEVEVITLAIDLTQPKAINIAIAQAWRNHGAVDILINCAGVVHQTPFLQSQVSKVEEEISLNFLGTISIVRLIAKRMAARKQGIIVNVSSLMGKVAAPTMATYSATKFAIVGFTQALRLELAPHNIRVITLLPSLTQTDMMRDLKLFRWVIPTTPETVAHSLIAGIKKDEPEILVGWQSHLAIWCQRICPWLLERILLLTAP